MPYQFKYSTDLTNEPFVCNIECRQCEHEILKTNGTYVRCKMKVCIGLPYCWRHMRSILHLKVAKSQIPEAGNGVYAYHPDPKERRIFRKNQPITTYDGELISKKEVDRRYTDSDEVTSPYTFSVGTTENYIDAACTRGVGGMFNFKPYTGKRNPNNVYAKKVQNQNKVMLYAKRDIYNGEEMFLDYGRAYNVDLNKDLHEYHTTHYVRPRRLSRRR